MHIFHKWVEKGNAYRVCGCGKRQIKVFRTTLFGQGMRWVTLKEEKP